MALKIAQENDYGAPMPDAYARITKVEKNHPAVGDSTVTMYVDWYYNQTARQNNKLTFGQSVFTKTFTPTEAVSLAELYAWLKTQPGFENAEDI